MLTLRVETLPPKLLFGRDGLVPTHMLIIFDRLMHSRWNTWSCLFKESDFYSYNMSFREALSYSRRITSHAWLLLRKTTKERYSLCSSSDCTRSWMKQNLTNNIRWTCCLSLHADKQRKTRSPEKICVERSCFTQLEFHNLRLKLILCLASEQNILYFATKNENILAHHDCKPKLQDELSFLHLRRSQCLAMWVWVNDMLRYEQSEALTNGWQHFAVIWFAVWTLWLMRTSLGLPFTDHSEMSGLPWWRFQCVYANTNDPESEPKDNFELWWSHAQRVYHAVTFFFHAPYLRSVDWLVSLPCQKGHIGVDVTSPTQQCSEWR